MKVFVGRKTTTNKQTVTHKAAAGKFSGSLLIEFHTMSTNSASAVRGKDRGIGAVKKGCNINNVMLVVFLPRSFRNEGRHIPQKCVINIMNPLAAASVVFVTYGTMQHIVLPGPIH